MPDDPFTRSPLTPPRRGTSLRTIFATAMLTVLGGSALIGYLAWNGTIRMDADVPGLIGSPAPTPSPALATPAPAAVPSAAASAAVAQVQGGFDQRVAALEQRLARLDLQAAAAEGNTARAEGLLVAFAARRAIERGAPLGYLADQLKLRFTAAQPAAVQTVIDAAGKPVTLDQLAGQLDALAPSLAAAPRDEGGWDRIKRGLSGLFVVRKDSTPSTRPEDRLERARLLLRTGQSAAAADEIGRMPGAAGAADWIAAARRYADAQKALDLIETTALLDSDKLKNASGQTVQQPSPAGPVGSPAAPEGAF
jgi:hypothetical protein